MLICGSIAQNAPSIWYYQVGGVLTNAIVGSLPASASTPNRRFYITAFEHNQSTAGTVTAALYINSALVWSFINGAAVAINQRISSRYNYPLSFPAFQAIELRLSSTAASTYNFCALHYFLHDPIAAEVGYPLARARLVY